MYLHSLNNRKQCVGLSGRSFSKQRLHQEGNTIQVLAAICQTCQSWKPLHDSWTTHSHRRDFDSLARLQGSPAYLLPCGVEKALHSAAAVAGKQSVQADLEGRKLGHISPTAGERKQEAAQWENNDRWCSDGRCVFVHIREVSVRCSDLYCNWQVVMPWLTTIQHTWYSDASVT